MKFYNSSNEEVNYHLLSKIGGGSYGSVYKLSEFECIKIFREIDTGIDADTIAFINNLSLDNFSKIYSFLFNKRKDLRGYTMKYYLPSYTSILLKDTSYTLDNFFAIQNSINTLSDKQIFITDLHSDNVILGNDEITIIDIDTYAKATLFDFDKLKNRNSKALYSLFKSLYIEGLYNHGIYSSYDIKTINNLFNNDAPSNIKVLKKYKYPIEYIHDMNRK